MNREILLGTIEVSNEEQIINFLQPIEYSDFITLKEEIQVVEKYNSNKELYSIFLINFIELTQYFQMAVDELVSKQIHVLENQREDFQVIYRNSNRLFLNLLSSGRTLLDHSETYLKRKYGKNSAEIIQFKLELNKIYDTNFEYRFIYKLRNYSQHCGLPINNLNYKFENVINEGAYSRVAKLNPTFIKEHLLLKYEEWGEIVRADIQKQSNEFPIMPIIHQYYSCIEQIFDKIKEIENHSLKNSISKIQKSIDLFSNYSNSMQLCVFYDFQYTVPNSYENSTFSVLTIPINLVEDIKDDCKIEFNP